MKKNHNGPENGSFEPYDSLSILVGVKYDLDIYHME